jgi:hypothetical protein
VFRHVGFFVAANAIKEQALMIRSSWRPAHGFADGRTFPIVFIATAISCLFAVPAVAAPILFTGNSSDGHPVSGSAEFTLNAGADTVAVKLTNTTALALDAGELLSGIDFSLGGLTPTLTSATGINLSVGSSGVFTDTGGPQNLSWSIVSLGSVNYQLNFNPDAKGSILGPPTAGSYEVANGSIKSNPGHDPFAAQMATFAFTVPNLEMNTPIVVRAFRYGTGLVSATRIIVPESATAALAVLDATLLS